MNKKKRSVSKKKKEKVNHHFVFIEVPIELVEPEVVLWGEAGWWPEDCLAVFERKSPPGEVKAGVRYKQRIKKPLAPGWKVEVEEVVPQKHVKRKFLNGIFKGSYEVVKMESRVNGTRIDYELHYKIRGPINKILWPLHFEKYHNDSIKLILRALKSYVTRKYKEQNDKEIDGL